MYVRPMNDPLRGLFFKIDPPKMKKKKNGLTPPKKKEKKRRKIVNYPTAFKGVGVQRHSVT